MGRSTCAAAIQTRARSSVTVSLAAESLSVEAVNNRTWQTVWDVPTHQSPGTKTQRESQSHIPLKNLARSRSGIHYAQAPSTQLRSPSRVPPINGKPPPPAHLFPLNLSSSAPISSAPHHLPLPNLPHPQPSKLQHNQPNLLSSPSPAPPGRR